MEIDSKRYVVIGNPQNPEKQKFVQALAKSQEAKSKLPVYILTTHTDDVQWFEDFAELTDSNDLLIRKPKRTRVECKMCGKCAQCCEYEAIQLNKMYQNIDIDYSKCVGCGDCLKHCKYGGFEEVECVVGVYNEYKISNKTKLLEAIVPEDYFYPHLIIKALERCFEVGVNIIYDVALSEDDMLIEDITRYAFKTFIYVEDASEILLYDTALTEQDNCIFISHKEIYSDTPVEIWNLSID